MKNKDDLKKEMSEIPAGFSFSRMHRMLKEKKKEEEKKLDAPSKKIEKKQKKEITSPEIKVKQETPVDIPRTASPVNDKIIPPTDKKTITVKQQPPIIQQTPVSVPDSELLPEVITAPILTLPEMPVSSVVLPRNTEQVISPAHNLFPASRFVGGEKRTTIRISTDLADRAKEFENKIYWLTKKRLSLAEQARIALTLFLELPLELDDMTADDDMELYILQKARKLLSNLNPGEDQSEKKNEFNY